MFHRNSLLAVCLVALALLVTSHTAHAQATVSPSDQQTIPYAPAAPLPPSHPQAEAYAQFPQMTIAQRRARFQAEQQMLRQEWYNWMGYTPMRPTVNASYMASTARHYYLPSRGAIVNLGGSRVWYW